MDKIHEIRVEEVNDHEEGKHFYRVYMEINETITTLIDLLEKSSAPDLNSECNFCNFTKKQINLVEQNNEK